MKSYSPLTLVTLLAALGWARPTLAQTLVRSPYLQLGSPSSMTVVWRTDTSTASVVRYGAAPDQLTQMASGAAGTQHEVKIGGLSPSTRYYYSVGTDAATLAGGDAEHYFVTSPAVGEKRKFRAWVVGDSGTAGGDQAMVRDAAMSKVGSTPPQLFLHMGDMAYADGKDQEFTDNFFAPYAGLLRHSVTWPTLGNHEGHTSDSGAETGPYYEAYVLPRAGEAGGLASGTEAYYSFDYANVHFIVLDSYDSPREPGGTMLAWLTDDLAATNQEWVIAYWHHPPYTKGSHDSDTESELIEMRENALPILEAGGVDVVLGGHSHIYERSFLLDGAYGTPTTADGHVLDDGSGDPSGTGPYAKGAGLSAHQGTVYIVAGHGGIGLNKKGEHPVMYLTEVQHGSCVLDVQGNTLALFNVRKDGQVSDRFAMVKGSGFVITAPDGGEQLTAGAVTAITWATVGTIANVRLEYSLDDGSSWTTIVESTPNTGSHAWTVPPYNSEVALVRVSDAASPSTLDESNAGFVVAGGSGPPPVASGGTSAGGAASSGGTSGAESGGTGGLSSAGGAPASAASGGLDSSGPPQPASRVAGCGCRTMGRPASLTWAAALAIVVAGGLWRRRQR